VSTLFNGHFRDKWELELPLDRTGTRTAKKAGGPPLDLGRYKQGKTAGREARMGQTGCCSSGFHGFFSEVTPRTRPKNKNIFQEGKKDARGERARPRKT